MDFSMQKTKDDTKGAKKDKYSIPGNFNCPLITLPVSKRHLTLVEEQKILCYNNIIEISRKIKDLRSIVVSNLTNRSPWRHFLYIRSSVCLLVSISWVSAVIAHVETRSVYYDMWLWESNSKLPVCIASTLLIKSSPSQYATIFDGQTGLNRSHGKFKRLFDTLNTQLWQAPASSNSVSLHGKQCCTLVKIILKKPQMSLNLQQYVPI